MLFGLLARTASMRAGFLIGLVWGLGFFIAGVSWVFVSLSVYGGMAAWLAALATFLFCTVLALFPATVGALQAYPKHALAVSPTLRLLLLMPARVGRDGMGARLAFHRLSVAGGGLFAGAGQPAGGLCAAASACMACRFCWR